jgi:translation initiation factor IF-2
MQTQRPPIVVILGHVDHGKTTLLDYLRQTEIAAREAGGITQHIRSFVFSRKSGSPITFIDTPGHEAFSQMRKRGSSLADIALLVVAADDGVMPQTKQSITFIQESRIPFIVVINKTDLPTADIDRVKTQLAEANVLVEDFGGQTPCVCISAKTGKGVPDLLEMIDLLTSLDPPQADFDANLEVVVLESRIDSKKGPLAVVLVKQGTLTVGSTLFQEERIGKVKALIDPEGNSISSAPPSAPVEILGLTLPPSVGSVISTHPLAASQPSSSQSVHAVSPPLANFIVKADVAGSLEAILAGLDPEAGLISSGTGDVNENDVLLAHTSQAQILAFNVRVSGNIVKLAETEKITISQFKIIYELFKYVTDLLHPKSDIQIVGRASILADFKINSDRIAGCKCTEGLIERTCNLKIVRDGQEIISTKIKSLHQGKTIVEKVKSGVEFGAIFSPYVDFKVGDDIIATIG